MGMGLMYIIKKEFLNYNAISHFNCKMQKNSIHIKTMPYSTQLFGIFKLFHKGITKSYPLNSVCTKISVHKAQWNLATTNIQFPNNAFANFSHTSFFWARSKPFVADDSASTTFDYTCLQPESLRAYRMIHYFRFSQPPGISHISHIVIKQFMSSTLRSIPSAPQSSSSHPRPHTP